MKTYEKLALVLLVAIGCFFCGHSEHHGAIAQHDVSACLVSCAGAAAVITTTVPERGQMCRCWAENAFSYTFSYPTTPEEFSYVRQRWNTGLKAAEQCRRQGLGWGPGPVRRQRRLPEAAVLRAAAGRPAAAHLARPATSERLASVRSSARMDAMGPATTGNVSGSLKRKTTYVHVTTSLERCTGCDRVVGGETITLADADTALIVSCPECSSSKILG